MVLHLLGVMYVVLAPFIFFHALISSTTGQLVVWLCIGSYVAMNAILYMYMYVLQQQPQMAVAVAVGSGQ